MFAVIRLVVTLPGASAPKVSWVILLSGPIGVMSVSPVARPATTTRKNVISTAITPIHQWMWKMCVAEHDHGQAQHDEPADEPRARHLDPLHRVVALAGAAGKNAVMVLNARTTVFHCRKNSSRPEVTIIGTPIHRLHDEIRRNAEPPLLAITPASMHDRRQDHVVDDGAEHQAPRLAEADDRAGRDEQQRALERQRELAGIW